MLVGTPVVLSWWMLAMFAIAGTQNFDVIRFATYRTACKLRFVQKRTNREFVCRLYIILPLYICIR